MTRRLASGAAPGRALAGRHDPAGREGPPGPALAPGSPIVGGVPARDSPGDGTRQGGSCPVTKCDIVSNVGEAGRRPAPLPDRLGGGLGAWADPDRRRARRFLSDPYRTSSQGAV